MDTHWGSLTEMQSVYSTARANWANTVGIFNTLPDILTDFSSALKLQNYYDKINKNSMYKMLKIVNLKSASTNFITTIIATVISFLYFFFSSQLSFINYKKEIFLFPLFFTLYGQNIKKNGSEFDLLKQVLLKTNEQEEFGFGPK